MPDTRHKTFPIKFAVIHAAQFGHHLNMAVTIAQIYLFLFPIVQELPSEVIEFSIVCLVLLIGDIHHSNRLSTKLALGVKPKAVAISDSGTAKFLNDRLFSVNSDVHEITQIAASWENKPSFSHVYSF